MHFGVFRLLMTDISRNYNFRSIKYEICVPTETQICLAAIFVLIVKFIRRNWMMQDFCNIFVVESLFLNLSGKVWDTEMSISVFKSFSIFFSKR